MTAKLYISEFFYWVRRSFLRREDGSISIEAMIIMPLMFWAYLSMFAIYDAFRSYGIHQKAAFTVGDAISRETVPLDGQYLNGVRDLFEYLAGSQGQTGMRVSQLWYDAGRDRYRRDWSRVRGNMTRLTNAEVANWHDKLPVMPDNERVILFETWSSYDPPFETGLTANEIRTFVFTRPRYAPAVCFNTCN